MLDKNGTLRFALQGDLGKVQDVIFASDQMTYLAQQNASIKVETSDVSLNIPATNFIKGQELTVKTEKLAKDASELPLSENEKQKKEQASSHKIDDELPNTTIQMNHWILFGLLVLTVGVGSYIIVHLQKN